MCKLKRLVHKVTLLSATVHDHNHDVNFILVFYMHLRYDKWVCMQIIFQKIAIPCTMFFIYNIFNFRLPNKKVNPVISKLRRHVCSWPNFPTPVPNRWKVQTVHDYLYNRKKSKNSIWSNYSVLYTTSKTCIKNSACLLHMLMTI